MLSIISIAIALSMDSFSVALCAGSSLLSPGISKPLLVGVYFGFFHALMVLVGWFGGDIVSGKFGTFDHWIAFAILFAIGAKMLFSKGGLEKKFSFAHANMAFLGLATSLDALGASASYAMSDFDLWPLLAAITFSVFVFSFGGVKTGRRLGKCFSDKAEFVGGLMLIIISLGILYKHGTFTF